MTHRLTTNCAKNYCNRTLNVKVIVENVVTCFLGTRCTLSHISDVYHPAKENDCQQMFIWYRLVLRVFCLLINIGHQRAIDFYTILVLIGVSFMISYTVVTLVRLTFVYQRVTIHLLYSVSPSSDITTCNCKRLALISANLHN